MREYKELPTVSVVVVTYNSSKFILETLESIKNQTYPHLSLIITDDCSTDKTIKLCKDWVDKNKDRFVETIILESPVNTGISANGNRGENVCKTQWVKGIAGDDILMPNCIQDNVNYILDHPDVDCLFSVVEVFGAKAQINKMYEGHFDYHFFDNSPAEQLERLIFKENCIPASTNFYRLSRMQALSISNDERIPMLEDWPKWINCLKKGIHFSFMDKVTVKYRIRKNSLSTSPLASVSFFHSLKLFYYYYQRESFIKKYGLDKTIEIEMDMWMEIYSNYYLYRNLLSSRAYFLFTHLKKIFLLFL